MGRSVCMCERWGGRCPGTGSAGSADGMLSAPAHTPTAWLCFEAIALLALTRRGSMNCHIEKHIATQVLEPRVQAAPGDDRIDGLGSPEGRHPRARCR